MKKEERLRKRNVKDQVSNRHFLKIRKATHTK